MSDELQTAVAKLLGRLDGGVDVAIDALYAQIWIEAARTTSILVVLWGIAIVAAIVVVKFSRMCKAECPRDESPRVLWFFYALYVAPVLFYTHEMAFRLITMFSNPEYWVLQKVIGRVL